MRPMATAPEEPPSLDGLITAAPGTRGGRRVFRRTRFPVAVVYENLADGLSIAEILDDDPTPDRRDVMHVLHLASAGPAAAKAA